ncbi:hypothetical protein GCM10027514_31790 [Azotobacter armeniacus]
MAVGAEAVQPDDTGIGDGLRFEDQGFGHGGLRAVVWRKVTQLCRGALRFLPPSSISDPPDIRLPSPETPSGRPS